MSILKIMVIAYRRNRNVLAWWVQEFELRRRCRGFYGWMKKRYGKPEIAPGCGWNWWVNGVLCTVWIDPAFVKIYEEGGRNTTTYHLSEWQQNKMARRHIERLAVMKGGEG